MSLCFSICLMLGLGVDSTFCFNNSLINFELLSLFTSALFIYIYIYTHICIYDYIFSDFIILYRNKIFL